MQTEQKIQTASHVRKGKTLNVGIIGCGRIAEHHLRFIAGTKDARISALCDPFTPNAHRLAEEYGVREVYNSHVEMLNSTALDVVHILTPPKFHYAQAVDAIEHGVHVLLEKPCTYEPEELVDLYRRAESRNLLLCADFIQLFAPPFLKAISLIDSGQLGKVVHINIHLSLDLAARELREAVGLHWSFNLPGGIFHNNVTHPIYLALRWLGEPIGVKVMPKSLGALPQGVTDHMMIAIEGKECTANVVLSGVIKPEPYYAQIYCERGSVLVDFDTSTVIVKRQSSLPSFVRRASANFQQSWHLLAAGVGNAIQFLRRRLVPYQGLEKLIPLFYQSIRDGVCPPVSKELALAVARTEQVVFAQAGKLHIDWQNKPSAQKSVNHSKRILVTGASGYLGSAITRRLVEEGCYVRALVRPLGRTEELVQLGVELYYGDVRNSESVIDAAQGMDIIIHTAAAMQGSSEFMRDCAVTGTRNVATAATNCNIKRVIYISSMSVYDSLKLQKMTVLSESSPLEEFAQLRGSYSLAKRQAEDEALSHLRDKNRGWTILRPSVIVGRGHDKFSLLGKKVGNFVLCPGSAKQFLRLIHVDDVAAVIAKLIQNEATSGRVFNISNDGITHKEYVDQYIRKIGFEKIRVIHIPYWLARSAAGTISMLRLFSSKVPTIHKRRLASLYQNARVDINAINEATGWESRRGLLETLVTEANESKLTRAAARVEEGMTKVAPLRG